MRRSRDVGRSTAATFELAQDEKIYGFGESFTRLNKRGQRVVAFIRDAMGAQSQLQYKAVPFFMSSRGYAMFVHTSAPVTFDVGAEFDAHHTIYSGDELLDLFIFLGEPKDLLSEYTARHRPQPGAAALVVRAVDEPHHVQVGSRGARRRGEAARVSHSRPTCCTSTPAGSRPTGAATISSRSRASPIRR